MGKEPACGLDVDRRFSYSLDTAQCGTVMVLILTKARCEIKWSHLE